MSNASAQRILIADDQPDVLEALRLLLKSEGYATDAAKSPAAVVKAVESKDYALVLMDLNYARDTTSGQEGLELLQKLQTLDAALPVVVMTAWASVDVAVEAMRRGARDFVTKPWDNPRLLAIVRNQIDLGCAVRAYRRLEQENQLLRPGGKSGPSLIAQSADATRPRSDCARRPVRRQRPHHWRKRHGQRPRRPSAARRIGARGKAFHLR